MQTTETGYKTIISKFRGTCRNCEKSFEAGTEILWKQGHAIHVACEATMPKAETFSEPAALEEKPKQKNLPRIPDGTYTVVFFDGSYLTLKFEIAKRGGFEGRRILSYLCGTDNDNDYAGFAFILENNEVKPWKRFDNMEKKDLIMEAVRTLYKSVIVNGEEAILQAGEAYAMRSSRCCKCGRTLTVPSSLHRGMGPECAKKSW